MAQWLRACTILKNLSLDPSTHRQLIDNFLLLQLQGIQCPVSSGPLGQLHSYTNPHTTPHNSELCQVNKCMEDWLRAQQHTQHPGRRSQLKASLCHMDDCCKEKKMQEASVAWMVMIPLDLLKFVHKLQGFSNLKIPPFFLFFLNKVSLCSPGWPTKAPLVSAGIVDTPCPSQLSFLLLLVRRCEWFSAGGDFAFSDIRGHLTVLRYSVFVKAEEGSYLQY